MDNYLREIKISMEKKDGDFEKFKINSSYESAKFFRAQMGDSIEIYETVMVLYLNNSLETMGWQKISQGGINSSVVDIRIVMSTAMKLLASAILICHNHPSGSLKPSHSDIKITKELQEAGKILHVQILDHVIITENSHFSFADECLM